MTSSQRRCDETGGLDVMTRSVLDSFSLPVYLGAARSAAAAVGGTVHSVCAREREDSLLTPPLFDTHTHTRTYTHTHPAVAEVREAGLPQGGASSVLPPWRRFFALIPFGPCSGAEPKRAYFSKVFVQGTLSFEGSPSPSINTRCCAKKQMEHTLESSSAHNEVPAPMGAGRGGDYSKALLGGCLLSCDDRYIRRGVFSLLVAVWRTWSGHTVVAVPSTR